MRPNCCHVSFAFVLKFLKFLQAFVGVSIILYPIWMLYQWNRHVPISPQPLPPSPESSFSILFDSRPKVGAQSPRVFDHSLSVSSPRWIMGSGLTWAPLSYLLHEAALEAFIAIDHSWEKDLLFDLTRELHSLRSFFEDTTGICKWAGIGLVIIQALALLVAIILRAIIPDRTRDIDNEDDCESVRRRTWELLLNRQSSHKSTSAKGDGRAPHSDIWGSRIKEKIS